jgi:glycosyltransferase involved in cell wall biosynthesis
MSAIGPKISVVVATFNAEATLDRCLRSFEAQTYPDSELIVYDGGSRDSTVAILRNHQDKLAYWKSEPDTGIYNAWNKALDQVTGDWVYFLGADDYFWSPEALAAMASHLASARPEYRIVYGKVAVVTRKGEVLNTEGIAWPEAKQMFRHEMTIPHQGVFHHRSLFEEHGKFNDTFRICGDYEILLRELKTRDALFVPEVTVAAMQFGGMSSTLKQTPRIIAELKKARQLNGVADFSWPLISRTLRSRIRIAMHSIAGEKLTNIVADLYRSSVGKPRIWTRKDL